MSDQGKANYEAVAASLGGTDDYYDKLSPAIQSAYDAGADAVEKWLADAPVDEDMPGGELAAENRKLRSLIGELLDSTGLSGDERARWLEMAGLDDEFLADAATLDSDFEDDL